MALDADPIEETIEKLHRRIEERFTGSGRGRVCATLEGIGVRRRRSYPLISKIVLSITSRYDRARSALYALQKW